MRATQWPVPSCSGGARHPGLCRAACRLTVGYALFQIANVTTACPEAIATGLRITFAVAAGLIAVALAIRPLRMAPQAD